MTPNPRIHRPSARSYSPGPTSIPTITQSTALWQAMRLREDEQRREDEIRQSVADGGLVMKLKYALSRLPLFGKRK